MKEKGNWKRRRQGNTDQDANSSLGSHFLFVLDTLIIPNQWQSYHYFKGLRYLLRTEVGDSWPPCSSYILSLEVLGSHWWIPKFSVPSPPRSRRTSKHSWPNWQCHSCAPWPFLRQSLHCDGWHTQTCLWLGWGTQNCAGQKGVSILLQQWADPTKKGGSAVTWEKVRVVIWLDSWEATLMK